MGGAEVHSGVVAHADDALDNESIPVVGTQATDHCFFIVSLLSHIFLEFCPLKMLVSEIIN